VRVTDLGEVHLVEQGHLQRAVVGGQGGDGGTRSAVTQQYSLRSRSASIWAQVIIPRSPTITTSVSLKVSLTVCTMALNTVGTAVLSPKTRTATGRPAGSVSRPYSIWGSPFLPSRE
jgi:hypothetical protein